MFEQLERHFNCTTTQTPTFLQRTMNNGDVKRERTVVVVIPLMSPLPLNA